MDTYYKTESLQNAINLTIELKNIMVCAQDYTNAATLRDIERVLLDKQQELNNKTV